MTDTDREFQSRFDAYRRNLSGDVRPPGAEAVQRTVLRRQRRRTAVAAALAVVAIVVALAQFAVDRAPDSAPIEPPGPSVTAPPSPVPSASPSASPSSASPSSASPSSRPPSSRPPSSVAPAEQVPAKRTYPVVDGYELHVVALPEVRLQPVDGLYRGIVYVDVYNSGRQPSNSSAVYVTEPAGVRFENQLGMGVCFRAAPPETWACGAEVVPAGGGYRRMPFDVQVNVAPGSTTQTIDGFAVRVMAQDQSGNQTDATPADNKVTVRLVLPPA